jgi:hypothetical protein
MSPPEPSNPVVGRLVAAINDRDRDAFLATLTVVVTAETEEQRRTRERPRAGWWSCNRGR